MLWSQPIPPASAPPWSDTFVGREAEWSAFARSLGELANGQAGGTRVFVVYGETGMGKSALLRRYRALAAARLPDDRIISIDLSQQHFTSARALAESIAAAVRARHPGFDATYDSDVRQRQRLADDYARVIFGESLLLWSPVYGKARLGGSVAHYDLHLDLGVGVVDSTTSRGAMGVAGVGMKLFAGQAVAFRLDARDRVYRQELLDERFLVNDVSITLGVSLVLPLSN